MLIDWFTVAAQAANFIILVWLLKRYLYKPILQTIAAREKLVADQLADAAAQKAGAQMARDEFQRKNDELARQRTTLLAQAAADADAERRKLMTVARQEFEKLRLNLHQAIENERESLSRQIAMRAQHEIFAITRQTLADLSSTSLEDSLCQAFVRSLQSMKPPGREHLVNALRTTAEPAIIRSAFELSRPQQNTIQDVVDHLSAGEIPILFEISPDLVAGLELIVNGRKIAWNISDYLSALQRSVNEIIDTRVKPETTNFVEAS